jgi:hypothetical protein
MSHNTIRVCHVDKHRATKSHCRHEQMALQEETPTQPYAVDSPPEFGDTFVADKDHILETEANGNLDWLQTEIPAIIDFAHQDIFQSLIDTAEFSSEQQPLMPQASTLENHEHELVDDSGEDSILDADPEQAAEFAPDPRPDHVLRNLQNLQRGSQEKSEYYPWPSKAVSTYTSENICLKSLFRCLQLTSSSRPLACVFRAPKRK